MIRNLFILFYRFKHANHDINEGAPLQFAIGSFSSIASNERIPTERGGQRRKRPKTTTEGRQLYIRQSFEHVEDKYTQ